MTPETRTIDLSALATELEAAGFKWEQDWDGNDEEFLAIELVNHPSRRRFVSVWADGETTDLSEMPDAMRAIVQRHIAGSRR